MCVCENGENKGFAPSSVVFLLKTGKMEKSEKLEWRRGLFHAATTQSKKQVMNLNRLSSFHFRRLLIPRLPRYDWASWLCQETRQGGPTFTLFNVLMSHTLRRHIYLCEQQNDEKSWEHSGFSLFNFHLNLYYSSCSWLLHTLGQVLEGERDRIQRESNLAYEL